MDTRTSSIPKTLLNTVTGVNNFLCESDIYEEKVSCPIKVNSLI